MVRDELAWGFIKHSQGSELYSKCDGKPREDCKHRANGI